MNRIIWFMIFLFGLELQAQDMYDAEYQKAYSLLKSDSELATIYCQSDTMSLMLFSRFEYISLTKFRDQLSGLVNDKQLKKLLKYDKNQANFKDKASFKLMSDFFYRSLKSNKNPCAIICFNRMNEGFILAEIMNYTEFGLDWKTLKSNKSTSHYILFDTRGEDIKLYKEDAIR